MSHGMSRKPVAASASSTARGLGEIALLAIGEREPAAEHGQAAVLGGDLLEQRDRLARGGPRSQATGMSWFIAERLRVRLPAPGRPRRPRSPAARPRRGRRRGARATSRTTGRIHRRIGWPTRSAISCIVASPRSISREVRRPHRGQHDVAGRPEAGTGSLRPAATASSSAAFARCSSSSSGVHSTAWRAHRTWASVVGVAVAARRGAFASSLRRRRSARSLGERLLELQLRQQARAPRPSSPSPSRAMRGLERGDAIGVDVARRALEAARVGEHGAGEPVGVSSCLGRAPAASSSVSPVRAVAGLALRLAQADEQLAAARAVGGVGSRRAARAPPRTSAQPRAGASRASAHRPASLGRRDRPLGLRRRRRAGGCASSPRPGFAAEHRARQRLGDPRCRRARCGVPSSLASAPGSAARE